MSRAAISYTSHVAWSACLCVFGTLVSCAETDEPIEMTFGDRLMLAQGSMHFDGSSSLAQQVAVWGEDIMDR